MKPKDLQILIASFAGLATLTAVTVLAIKRKRCNQSNKAKPKMKLYWFDHFRSRRCEWLLAELGGLSDVEMICMNPKDPDQEKLAQYRLVHPHGTIPCLEIENQTTIIESGAICMYVAELYEDMVPDDKASYYNWITYSIATLDETMEHLYLQWQFTALEEQDTDLINKMIRKFQVFAQHFSKFMTGREFICGKRLTAADCVLGYNLFWAMSMRDGVLLKDYPVILDYFNRLSRRSAFQRIFNDSD